MMAAALIVIRIIIIISDVPKQRIPHEVAACRRRGFALSAVLPSFDFRSFHVPAQVGPASNEISMDVPALVGTVPHPFESPHVELPLKAFVLLLVGEVLRHDSRLECRPVVNFEPV